jgi:nucleoside-diphosphate-sugar epimerase
MSIGRVAVLGASGQIGQLLVEELGKSGIPTLACGRNFRSQQRGDVHYLPIDPLDTASLTRSLAGCSSVISTLGLPYKSATWLAQWPAMIRSVLDTAEKLRVPLTVLDNAYVYGRTHGPMTEESPLSPCSKKGSARLNGWRLIEDRMRAGADIVVGRAADFIGKDVNNSVLPWKSIEGLAQSGRRVRSLQWIGDPSTRHTYAYARDIAQGLVLLDQDKSSRETALVHLPVVSGATGNEIGAVLSEMLKCRVVVRPIPPLLMNVASVVSTAAREQLEMMYQVDQDFIFDDTKFRIHQPDFHQRTITDVFRADL